MRVAYLGRDLFAPCLQAVMDAGHSIVDLRTTHGPGATLSERVHQLADAHQLPVSIGHVGVSEMRAIAASQPDVLVCAGWPRRLPDPSDFGMRGVNVHPSCLPDGRGPWPLPHVILKGLDRTGVTVHRLAPAFDAGPILAQRSYAVPPWFDLDDLIRRTRQVGAALLVDCLAAFDTHWANARPQGDGSWWPKLTQTHRILDWHQPAEVVFRRARAFGRDGVFGEIEGRTQRLVGLDLVCSGGEGSEDAPGHQAPGSVLARSAGRVTVAALDGAVEFATAD